MAILENPFTNDPYSRKNKKKKQLQEELQQEYHNPKSKKADSSSALVITHVTTASIGPPLEPFRTRFTSPKLYSHRRSVFKAFLLTNFIIGCFIIPCLSIYWGATYRRPHFLHTLNLIAVFQDDYVQTNEKFPFIDESFAKLTDNVTPMLDEAYSCKWHVYNTSQFMSKFNVSKDEIDRHVVHLIYEEKYWMAVNIKANSTQKLLNSLLPHIEPAYKPFNFSDNFQIIYESGRDPTNLKASMLPVMQSFEKVYENYYSTMFYPSLLRNITTSGVDINILNSTDLGKAGMMRYGYFDHRPFTDYALVSPLQVGLIYCLLLTAFQFAVYGPLHAKMSRILTFKHLIVYRIIIMWSTMFFLSLFFCTVSAVFRINFTLAFGKAGFVVYWASTWLVMLALGGANENAITLVNVFGRQYLMVWLMSWIILNISPSFYPLALNSNFYRYGYAMPVHQAVDIFKVIFLDLTRRKMGRNYGILAVWVVINTACLPLTLIIAHKKIEKDRKKAWLTKHNGTNTTTPNSASTNNLNPDMVSPDSATRHEIDITPELMAKMNSSDPTTEKNYYMPGTTLTTTSTDERASSSSTITLGSISTEGSAADDEVADTVIPYNTPNAYLPGSSNTATVPSKINVTESHASIPNVNHISTITSSPANLSINETENDFNLAMDPYLNSEDHYSEVDDTFVDPGDNQNNNNNGDDLDIEDYRGLGYEYDAQEVIGFGLPYDVSQNDDEIARLDSKRAEFARLQKTKSSSHNTSENSLRKTKSVHSLRPIKSIKNLKKDLDL
ncbi:hypothetical protein TBLA_0B07660 [Henningerozyma blattae CBS 6284]|uniref:DUF3533 domain-containing protein n=1 Tax=Henningerozyma blattae (strain ATCC 34711 / CBS 6284 / DSM 70876 / NBRC 10599 / NRRL Y-10934 / UCD 77-7) TaxID=1071380 RepID=I2GZN0_HENB6|nr:hypothetical protein TBLA_0B07660 [Tetrapisispora blattae CBS 6284]CCH59582.1 hypothetical protein TBLA_0B07660 [Tetrapisispora blattae CBS 6284]